MGQQFNINVVDCVNAPGVKIYSGSMASGIVGFFSVEVTAASNNGAVHDGNDGEYRAEYRSLPQLCVTDDLVGTNFAPVSSVTATVTAWADTEYLYPELLFRADQVG